MDTIIYNADCFDILRTIEENSINLVFVDLPYGQTDCDWDICIDLNRMWSDLKLICTKTCIYVFCCTTKFGYKIIDSNPKWFRYDLIWKKSNGVGFLNAKIKPLINHEMLYIFKKPGRGGTYNPQMTVGKPYIKQASNIKCAIYGSNKQVKKINTGTRYPKSILEFKYDKEKFHPTQKPVELCEWIVKTYSNEDDIVLDFCMGSGSTGVACQNLNRHFIGIEKTKEYYEISKKRLEID